MDFLFAVKIGGDARGLTFYFLCLQLGEFSLCNTSTLNFNICRGVGMNLHKLSGKVFGKFRPHRGNTDNTEFSFLDNLTITCLLNFRMGLGDGTFGSNKNLVRGEMGHS